MNMNATQDLMDDFADVQTPETYTGMYFDGKSSTRKYVSLLIVGKHVSLLGDDLSRRDNGVELEVNTPARHGALLVKFKDGAVCELPPTKMLYNRLRMTGARTAEHAFGASVLSSDWRLVALVGAFLVGTITAAYAWLIPAAAQVLAPMVPSSFKQNISAQAVRAMDARWLEPSRLSESTQAQIRQRFARLQSHLEARQHEARPAELLAQLQLRATRLAEGKPVIGPNALALPGGTIVLTDEMVALLKEDMDALSGVLAHELGHVVYDHGTQGLIKATALTALGSVIIGDYSQVLATAPVVLGQLKYGREAEAQADAFAFELLCSKGIDPGPTAKLFDELQKKQTKDKAADKGEDLNMPEFMHSHPGNAGRAQVFRQRCPA
jgi:Zn-dependent protease with chaperone function